MLSGEFINKKNNVFIKQLSGLDPDFLFVIEKLSKLKITNFSKVLNFGKVMF